MSEQRVWPMDRWRIKLEIELDVEPNSTEEEVRNQAHYWLYSQIEGWHASRLDKGYNWVYDQLVLERIDSAEEKAGYEMDKQRVWSVASFKIRGHLEKEDIEAIEEALQEIFWTDVLVDVSYESECCCEDSQV